MSRRLGWLCTAVAAVLAIGWWLRPAPSARQVEFEVNPVSFFAPEWQDVLGGDAPTPDASGIDLTRFVALGDLTGPARAHATVLVEDLMYAATTGAGQDRFDGYFLETARPSTFCTDVTVLGSSTYTLPLEPIGAYAKSLVLWSGACPFPPPAVASTNDRPVYVAFVYLATVAGYPRPVAEPLAAAYGGWVPVRPTEYPQAAAWFRPVTPPPAAWETGPLLGCAAPGLIARLEVVAAFDALCQAARTVGLPLYATDALRTPAQQFERFTAAVDAYGSERAARTKVAYSDGTTCDSMHCAGEAIDVANDPAVLAWLRAQVGCITGAGVFVDQTAPCTAATAVSRLERYGFVASPLAPTHIEYALGTTSTDASIYGDCTPGAVPVAVRIELVFKCRIIEAGLGTELAATAAPEAVRVAECISGLNPSYRAYDGRYATTPNPTTGKVDDAAGIFGLTTLAAERLIAPPGTRLQATAHIDAAARWFVEERVFGRSGFDPFACAGRS